MHKRRARAFIPYKARQARIANMGRCGYVQILPHLTTQWRTKTSQKRKRAQTKSNGGSVESVATAAHTPYRKFSSRYANLTLLP